MSATDEPLFLRRTRAVAERLCAAAGVELLCINEIHDDSDRLDALEVRMKRWNYAVMIIPHGELLEQATKVLLGPADRTLGDVIDEVAAHHIGAAIEALTGAPT